MSEQKVSITLYEGFLCTAGAAGGCQSLRIIAKGTEHRIKDLGSECPSVCTPEFPGSQRAYTDLKQIYVKADVVYDTLGKKREIPELPSPQHFSQP